MFVRFDGKLFTKLAGDMTKINAVGANGAVMHRGKTPTVKPLVNDGARGKQYSLGISTKGDLMGKGANLKETDGSSVAGAISQSRWQAVHSNGISAAAIAGGATAFGVLAVVVYVRRLRSRRYQGYDNLVREAARL